MTRVAISAGIIVLALGCGDRPLTRTTPAPTALPPAPGPPTSHTLSGVVYESTPTGHRTLAGVPLDISREYSSFPPRLTTDAQGRYELSGLPAGSLKVAAELSGYSQPCRAAALVDRDVILDVYLVSDGLLSTSGVPASMPVIEPTVSGRVVEPTPQGPRPVAGARVTVDFSGGMGWAPSATTVTDAAGQYLLCGVVDLGLGLQLVASKQGYHYVIVPIDVRQSANYDIELAR